MSSQTWPDSTPSGLSRHPLAQDSSTGISELLVQVESGDLGEQMYALMGDLFPICRSISGEGFRETQRRIAKHMNGFELRGVPSGTQTFDWAVPKEWNIQDAYVAKPSGERVIDFRKSNLHVVNYSAPVSRRMSLEELKPHLHTLPEFPDWIPYRTSYYKPAWGFCLAHKDYERLQAGEYEVVIDSSLADGELNYGECLAPGQSTDEVVLTAHACHPSLCNDNLSGVVVLTYLAKLLQGVETRYSYRSLFLPGGIGSVVWLSQNVLHLGRIKHGLVLSCLGDAGGFTYKRTRRGNAEIDQAVEHVLKFSEWPHKIIDFSPYGYDERNFNSPAFNLPVGSLTRSTHSEFAGYHSSGDNMDLVRPEHLQESLSAYLSVVEVLEQNDRFLNLIPEAEPQLGKRGLYGLMGGLQERGPMEMALLWVMNYSDGEHTLLDIADRSGYPFRLIRKASQLLVEQGILRKAAPGESTCAL